MVEVALTQFRTRALLKMGLLANLGIWALLSTLAGVAALAGFNTARWNGAPVHGPMGLVLSWLLGLVFTAVGAVLFAVGAKLIGLLGRRLPRIAMKDG